MRASLLFGVGLTTFVLGAGQEFQLPQLSPLQITRVERMLEGRLACRGCHVIAGRGGQIGPALDGLAGRSTQSSVLRMIRDPAATVPGTLMPRHAMPDRESLRLAAYLWSLPAGSAAEAASNAQPPTAIPSGQENDGAALYARHCAACHGPTGMGDGWNAPNLPVPPTVHAGATLMSTRADDTLYDGIAAGAFVLDGSPRMPAFGQMLSPEQIRILVHHIRTLCECAGPPWSTEGDGQ